MMAIGYHHQFEIIAISGEFMQNGARDSSNFPFVRNLRRQQCVWSPASITPRPYDPSQVMTIPTFLAPALKLMQSYDFQNSPVLWDSFPVFKGIIVAYYTSAVSF